MGGVEVRKRITKRFVVDLSYTDSQAYISALSAMIKEAVREKFADDDDTIVEKVGLLNIVLGKEKAKEQRK